ncbi:MAG: RsmB/NOP family class I SAM-dependent RNA methyltransferase [Infirmifilum sp.]
MTSEVVSPFTVRLAALTLELIERRSLSLEAAYLEASKLVERGDLNAVKLARIALRHFAKADLLLDAQRLSDLPLRRRCAFRVVFAMMKEGLNPSGIDVGLLSGRLRVLLTRRWLELADQLAAEKPPLQRTSLEHSFPPWIAEEVAKFLGPEEAIKLIKACDRRTIWVRVNELKISVNEAARRLRREGLEIREDRDFPELLEVLNVEEVPLPVQKMAERGLVLVQDKGSVAVVHALGQARRLLVLDAAAAPGVKTSAIQQLSANEAEVVAVDVSRRRVREMKALLSKLGVRNVHIVTSDSRLLRFARKFDKVLLDAPCTNSGALASDPALRLSLWKPPRLDRYTTLQLELLRTTYSQLKEGGALVYSTCSLLSSEGEAVVERLDQGALRAEGVLGEPGYRAFSCSGGVRRLYPHIHRTVGFFIAKVQKTEGGDG